MTVELKLKTGVKKENMKKLLYLLIMFIGIYAGANEIKGYKEFKLCMPITEVEKIQEVESFNFYNPLAFIKMKNKLYLEDVEMNNAPFTLAFSHGKLSSIHLTTYSSNFKHLYNAFEHKYNKKFIFIKSKDKEVCDYYQLTKNNVDIMLVSECGIATNYMSVYFNKECKKDY